MTLPICQRCNKEVKTHTMSWFNTDIICHECSLEESEHALYKQAKDIENEEVKKGNYNYPGVFAGKTWDEIKKITSL